MNKSQWLASLAIAGIASIGLTACSTSVETHLDGSRVELYDSIRGIAADSSLVVVAEVNGQSVEKKDIPYTLSTVEVSTSYRPSDLGSELHGGAAVLDVSKIVVRQMGDAQTETPAPILEQGKTYLLFLTPTMLDGDAASQFYVTGGSAGIYSATGETFTHGRFTEGDTLPETLTSDDLQP